MHLHVPFGPTCTFLLGRTMHRCTSQNSHGVVIFFTMGNKLRGLSIAAFESSCTRCTRCRFEGIKSSICKWNGPIATQCSFKNFFFSFCSPRKPTPCGFNCFSTVDGSNKMAFTGLTWKWFIFNLWAGSEGECPWSPCVHADPTQCNATPPILPVRQWRDTKR